MIKKQKILFLLVLCLAIIVLAYVKVQIDRGKDSSIGDRLEILDEKKDDIQFEKVKKQARRIPIDYLDGLTDQDLNILQKQENYDKLYKRQVRCNYKSGNEKDECLDKMRLMQVLLLDKPELCNELEYYKDNCFSEQAFKRKDLQLCDSIIDSSSKNFCKNLLTHTKALKKNDITLCSNINDNNRKQDCISGVISRQDDLSFCDSEFIANNNFINECKSIILSHQAWENNDPSICEQIPLESYKEVCFEEM